VITIEGIDEKAARVASSVGSMYGMASGPARRHQPVRIAHVLVRTAGEASNAVAAAQGEALRELLATLAADAPDRPDGHGRPAPNAGPTS
jgi:hypothetical protein